MTIVPQTRSETVFNHSRSHSVCAAKRERDLLLIETRSTSNSSSKRHGGFSCKKRKRCAAASRLKSASFQRRMVNFVFVRGFSLPPKPSQLDRWMSRQSLAAKSCRIRSIGTKPTTVQKGYRFQYLPRRRSIHTEGTVEPSLFYAYVEVVREYPTYFE